MRSANVWDMTVDINTSSGTHCQDFHIMSSDEEGSELGQSSSLTFKMGGRSLVACFMMFGTFEFKSTPDRHMCLG
jgi:hypothetical protein